MVYSNYEWPKSKHWEKIFNYIEEEVQIESLEKFQYKIR